MTDPADLDDLLARWQAAGIYDPTAPLEADLRSLIEFYDSVGVEPERFAGVSADPDELAMEVNRALLRPGERFGPTEAARRAGLGVDELLEMAHGSGYSPDAEFTDLDVAAFKAYAGASALFSDRELTLFSRVLGQAMTQVAEASSALFRIDVGALQAENRLAFAQANFLAAQLVDDSLMTAAKAFLLYGLEQATLRGDVSRARATHEASAVVAIAVGFVDLVGFTPLTAELDLAELSDFVADFEETASAVVVERGGRVVKLIGDEVMFVATEPADCAAIAVQLIEAFGGEGTAPRGGVAYGDVIARGGDYYGVIVNMASRMAASAGSGELLVNREVTTAMPDMDFGEPQSIELKGFKEPVEVYRRLVIRRPGD